MRLTPVMAAAAVLVMAPGAVFGQDWTEFASREDRFTCNFPGQPRVSSTTWTSEYGAALPARVYTAEVPSGRYLMMVVDYRLVNGHQLHLTDPDKSRMFASIYMHENRLYVMEGTVPDGYPEPGLFQQSLGWLDEKGNGIRYSQIYLYGAPPPPIASRGGQGGFGRINAPGAAAR